MSDTRPDPVNIARSAEALAEFPGVLRSLLQHLSPAEARHRPPSGAWSIVEIANHLADEETDDFPKRLRLTLQDPKQDWPGIDPEGWARQRDYQSRDLAESLERFARLRAESVAWLRALKDPDWSSAHEHPAGTLRAGDLLAAWLAHDMLHLRQIAKRLWELAPQRAGGFDPGYAGPWGA